MEQKIYTIAHDTRENGNGILNGEISLSRDTLIKMIEKYVGTKCTEYDDLGWQEDGSYTGEDDCIYIYEKELR